MKNSLSLFRSLLVAGMLVLGMSAEAGVVSGTVTDQTGETIISASVVVKGTSTGTVTDFDGNYQLDVPSDAVLVFSYIGLVTQEIPVNGQSVINVVLKENAEVLDEVVVTGYGTTKKRDLVTAVASVGAEQLKDIPVNSAAEALQGKLAGVSVTTTEGSPDAEVKIRVRGGTSLTQSNDPLYIVDGFPVSSISDIAPSSILSMDVLKDAAATAIYGAQGANGVIIITTKDADTDSEDKPVIHADYAGYVGWKKISNYMNTLSTRDFMLMQYENEFLKGSSTSFPEHFIPGYDKDVDTYDLVAMLNGADALERTDWQRRTFGRTGFDSNHSITLSGGTKKANFNMNYTRVDNKAIMEASDYHRNNLSLKAKFQPAKNLTVSFNTRYSDTKVLGAGSNTTKDAGSTSESRLRNSVAFTPVTLYKKDQGSLDDAEQYGNMYDPITTIADNYKLKKEMRFNVGGYIQYKFLKNFTVKGELGYDYKSVHTDRFYGETTYFARTNCNEKSAGIVTDEYDTKFRETFTFNWDQTFNSAHHASVLVGQEIIMNKGWDNTQTFIGFDATMKGEDVFKHLGSASSVTAKNYIDPTDNMLSFFARANYDYKSRYYVSLTMRADGSTRFAKKNQWGFFPSAALAWNLAEEDFMEKAREVCLSQMKLRFSYGTAGNNNVDLGYLHMDFLASSIGNAASSWISGFDNMLTAGGSDKIAPNPNLKWETTVTRNLGLDFGFLNQRLSGTLDLYWNTTKDLIVRYNLSTGYNYQFRNIGSTDNKGVEVSLTGIILDKRDKNLHYNLSLTANVSANKNRVVSLGSGTDYIEGKTNAFSTGNITQTEFYVYPGQAIGNIYGYETDGYYTAQDFTKVTPKNTQGGTKTQTWVLSPDALKQHEGLGSPFPGMMKLKDQNGDGLIDDKDLVVLGNTSPKAAGGFSLNFNIGGEKWGQIDLAANFTYSIGNKVLNLNKVDWTTITNADTKTSYRNALSTMSFDNRYSMFDDNGNYLPETYMGEGLDYAAMAARLDAFNDAKGATMWSPYMKSYAVTDYCVEDASFLRLNQLTLGYSLSDAWISKAYITKCRIYVQATNLFCATKYSGFDPEVDVYSSKNPLTPGVDFSAYPKSIGVNVGVNLSF